MPIVGEADPVIVSANQVAEPIGASQVVRQRGHFEEQFGRDIDHFDTEARRAGFVEVVDFLEDRVDDAERTKMVHHERQYRQISVPEVNQDVCVREENLRTL